jgi:hypothetical protein
MVRIIPFISYSSASLLIEKRALRNLLLTILSFRQEKVEKVEKEENSEVENQKGPIIKICTCRTTGKAYDAFDMIFNLMVYSSQLEEFIDS